jgi:hypothetical protein
MYQQNIEVVSVQRLITDVSTAPSLVVTPRVFAANSVVPRTDLPDLDPEQMHALLQVNFADCFRFLCVRYCCEVL